MCGISIARKRYGAHVLSELTDYVVCEQKCSTPLREQMGALGNACILLLETNPAIHRSAASGTQMGASLACDQQSTKRAPIAHRF